MNDAAKEAEWRKEFERDGAHHVYETAQGNTYGNYPEEKRQYAIRWLREMDRQKDTRDCDTYWYVKWTFWAAIVAAIASVISIVLAALQRLG